VGVSPIWCSWLFEMDTGWWRPVGVLGRVRLEVFGIRGKIIAGGTSR
jgi:hypothetical protein